MFGVGTVVSIESGRVRLKRCEYQRVCDDCHSVLKDDPEDLKALFRAVWKSKFTARSC